MRSARVPAKGREHVVVHNVILNSGGARKPGNQSVGGGKGQDWKEKGVRDVPPSRNRVVNNIIVGRMGELLVVDGAPDNVVDANLVCASGAAQVPTWGERAVKGDPKFRDAAAGDYRLSSDSPALKAGLALPGVADSAAIGAAAAPRVYGPDAPE